jgi:hypothetical protein
MKAFALEESWEVIRQVLPADLEALAGQSGSFQRARRCSLVYNWNFGRSY